MPNKVFKRVCCILLACLGVFCCACTQFGEFGKITETYDLANYGVVYGTQFEHKSFIERDFQSIFPSEILPSFENVQYHYATTDYGMAYEFNLEFSIPDEDEFLAYVETVAPMENFQVFPYDENYLEYLPCENYLSMILEDEFAKEDPLTFDWVDQAAIKRVLINPSENTIVIVCMRVGAGTIFASETLRLDFFLRRFHIDPRQFAADYGDGWEHMS